MSRNNQQKKKGRQSAQEYGGKNQSSSFAWLFTLPKKIYGGFFALGSSVRQLFGSMFRFFSGGSATEKIVQDQSISREDLGKIINPESIIPAETNQTLQKQYYTQLLEGIKEYLPPNDQAMKQIIEADISKVNIKHYEDVNIKHYEDFYKEISCPYNNPVKVTEKYLQIAEIYNGTEQGRQYMSSADGEKTPTSLFDLKLGGGEKSSENGIREHTQHDPPNSLQRSEVAGRDAVMGNDSQKHREDPVADIRRHAQGYLKKMKGEPKAQWIEDFKAVVGRFKKRYEDKISEIDRKSSQAPNAEAEQLKQTKQKYMDAVLQCDQSVQDLQAVYMEILVKKIKNCLETDPGLQEKIQMPASFTDGRERCIKDFEEALTALESSQRLLSRLNPFSSNASRAAIVVKDLQNKYGQIQPAGEGEGPLTTGHTAQGASDMGTHNQILNSEIQDQPSNLVQIFHAGRRASPHLGPNQRSSQTLGEQARQNSVDARNQLRVLTKKDEQGSEGKPHDSTRTQGRKPG